jgi:hypothetical protein
MIDRLTLLTAIFSAIATGLAAVATWRAPATAARLAESLRRDAERADERRRMKLNVFATLMQERAQIHLENGVRALNSIDIVFNDSREVREAWSELYLAFEMKPLVGHVIEERLRKLLAAIAKDVGLAEQLRNDDIGRVYFPQVLQEDQLVKQIQRQQVIASSGAGNAAQTNLWPPKPV